jgi:hypothetical protein
MSERSNSTFRALRGPKLPFLVAAAIGVSASCSNIADDCRSTLSCPLDDDASGGDGGASDGSGGLSSAGGDENLGGSAGQSGDSSAGEGGEGGGAGASGSCDSSLSPSAEPCVVSNTHAIFVASDGSDEAEGTREAPLETLSKAIELATASDKIVIACNATYNEALTITGSARIYGGFACPDDSAAEAWTYQAGTRALVAPAAEGAALNIEDVADEIIIEDIQFDARDAIEPGASSIAAVVLKSENVVFRRSKFVAGNGSVGDNGDNGEDGRDGELVLAAQKGVDAGCGAGAPASEPGGSWPEDASSCGSLPGDGGAATKNNDGSPGLPGDPRTNVTPPRYDNAGAKGVLADGTTPATPGGDGLPGSAGKMGNAGAAAPANGSFSKSGYTAASSSGAGKPGFTGQGGGGGGASSATTGCIGASGGAGGMGGCGGTAGKGGGSGGASVAVFSFDSLVTFDTCELQSGDGGDGGSGGDGGVGGAGQNGADGGLAFSDGSNRIEHAGKGGKGGSGGDGGPGAGGSGGPSFALVYHGKAPKQDDSTTLLQGDGGKAGPGGVSGSDADSVTAPAGEAGLSEQTLVVK